MRDIRNRPRWDSKTMETTIIQEYSKNLITFRNKIHMPVISDRDFAEKMIIFQTDENTCYSYFSTLPDNVYPEKDGCVRGHTIYGVNCTQKIGKQIFIRTSSQKDIKASLSGILTLGMVGSRAAEGLKVFRDELIVRARTLMRLNYGK